MKHNSVVNQTTCGFYTQEKKIVGIFLSTINAPVKSVHEIELYLHHFFSFSFVLHSIKIIILQHLEVIVWYRIGSRTIIYRRHTQK